MESMPSQTTLQHHPEPAMKDNQRLYIPTCLLPFCAAFLRFGTGGRTWQLLFLVYWKRLELHQALVPFSLNNLAANIIAYYRKILARFNVLVLEFLKSIAPTIKLFVVERLQNAKEPFTSDHFWCEVQVLESCLELQWTRLTVCHFGLHPLPAWHPPTSCIISAHFLHDIRPHVTPTSCIISAHSYFLIDCSYPRFVACIDIG